MPLRFTCSLGVHGVIYEILFLRNTVPRLSTRTMYECLGLKCLREHIRYYCASSIRDVPGSESLREETHLM